LSNHKIKRYVQIGSSAEYGNSNYGQLESDISYPSSPYGFAKLCITNLIKMLHKSEQFPGVVIRFFLLYGPYQKEDRFIPYVINNCLKNKLFYTTHGLQKRDFCYVEDAVEGIIEAMLNEKAVGEIFNIGSGIPVQTNDIVSIIQNKVSSGTVQKGQHERDNDVDILYANIEKAKKILNWEQKTSLEEGLTKTILSYKLAITNE
jgi:nucleoside-diphosphate-sugar epimerase